MGPRFFTLGQLLAKSLVISRVLQLHTPMSRMSRDAAAQQAPSEEYFEFTGRRSSASVYLDLAYAASNTLVTLHYCRASWLRW